MISRYETTFACDEDGAFVDSVPPASRRRRSRPSPDDLHHGIAGLDAVADELVRHKVEIRDEQASALVEELRAAPRGAGSGGRGVGGARSALATRLKRSPRPRRSPQGAGYFRRGREGLRRAPEVSATATPASFARRTPFSGPGDSRLRAAALQWPPEAILAAAEVAGGPRRRSGAANGPSGRVLLLAAGRLPLLADLALR